MTEGRTPIHPLLPDPLLRAARRAVKGESTSEPDVTVQENGLTFKGSFTLELRRSPGGQPTHTEAEPMCKLEAGELARLIGRVAYAAVPTSRVETVMRSVQIDALATGAVQAMAMDGFRIAIASTAREVYVPRDGDPLRDGFVTLARPQAERLAAFLERPEWHGVQVRVCREGGAACFEGRGWCGFAASLPMSHTYGLPDLYRLWQHPVKGSVRVGRWALINALEDLDWPRPSTPNVFRVMLKFTGAGLEVHDNGLVGVAPVSRSEWRESLAPIWINPRFWAEALNQAEGEEVELCFLGLNLVALRQEHYAALFTYTMRPMG